MLRTSAGRHTVMPHSDLLQECACMRADANRMCCAAGAAARAAHLSAAGRARRRRRQGARRGRPAQRCVRSDRLRRRVTLCTLRLPSHAVVCAHACHRRSARATAACFYYDTQPCTGSSGGGRRADSATDLNAAIAAVGKSARGRPALVRTVSVRSGADFTSVSMTSALQVEEAEAAPARSASQRCGVRARCAWARTISCTQAHCHWR